MTVNFRYWLARLNSLQPVRVLTTRNYGLYAAGNSLSLIGTWMQRIGVGWLAWELTHSATWLGLIAFADLFPVLIAGPIGGVMADRIERKRIIAVCQSINMLVALCLFGFAILNWLTIWVLFALVLCSGTAVGFNQPARLAFVPSLVETKDLPTAVALNAIIFNTARFIGPMFAGAVIVSANVAWVFCLNGLSFLFFLFALTLIQPRVEAQRKSGPRGLAASILDGINYTRGQINIARLILLLVLLSLAVRPFVELLPAFADEVYARGAAGLALFSSAIGLGAIIGALFMSFQVNAKAVLAQTVTASTVVGCSVIAFALSTDFWLAVLSTSVAGVAMVISGVGAQTYIQLHVDTDMRGRVMSLYGLIMRGGPALGALMMGLLAEFLGLSPPLLIGAVVTVLFCLWLRPQTK